MSHQWFNGLGPCTNSLHSINYLHIASFTTKNAGDTLLPIVLRDLITQNIPEVTWSAKHVHDTVTKSMLDYINTHKALFLGGGGLFLGDTNANNLSGWQWPISEDRICQITCPIVVFAVGFNKFRGQAEFSSNFRRTINALVRKSVFIGLRNNGSISDLNEYLDSDLQSKIAFQPCMTTLVKKIYPSLFVNQFIPDEPIVVLNCAFDRSKNRYGEHKEEILKSISAAMASLSKHVKIVYYSHTRQDNEILPYLHSQNFWFDHVDLFDKPPSFVLDAYKNVNIVIGMRGHSQMIPFGCNVPIISLVSHNKLRWFLDDVGMSSSAIETSSTNLQEQIVAKTYELLHGQDFARHLISERISELHRVTIGNISRIKALLSVVG